MRSMMETREIHKEVAELYYLKYIVDQLFANEGDEVAMDSDQYYAYTELCELGQMAESGEWD